MSTFSAGLFHRDGRIRGSYVYMLMCAENEVIHIKVGYTNSPSARLRTLRMGCPFIPEIFATAEAPGHAMAKKLETELHVALAGWRTHGEWFAFTDADRDAFNLAWKAVFTHFSKPSWPLHWVKTPIAPLVALSNQRTAAFRRNWAGRGLAYQDFRRHLQGASQT